MSEKFDVKSIEALEADIKKALQAVEKKHEVTIAYESPNNFQFYSTKMSLTISKPMPFADEYRRVAAQYGLKPEWLGKGFRGEDSRMYRIIGFDSAHQQVVVAKILRSGKVGVIYHYETEAVVKEMTRWDELVAKVTAQKPEVAATGESAH